MRSREGLAKLSRGEAEAESDEESLNCMGVVPERIESQTLDWDSQSGAPELITVVHVTYSMKGDQSQSDIKHRCVCVCVCVILLFLFCKKKAQITGFSSVTTHQRLQWGEGSTD